MRPPRAPASGAVALFGVLSLAPPAGAQTPPACTVVETCKVPRHAGEVGIVLLGDSGYGPGGGSEWGSHSQAQVAARLEGLCPRPDLVFFLGDNIYWRGSPDLFGPRFDTMYRSLFDAEHRRVHAALGNHDVKGCQVTGEPGFASGESCLDALQRAVREDVRRDVPAAGGAPGQTAAATEAARAAEAVQTAPAEQAAEAAARWLAPEIRERASKVPAADCPSAFDSGYEQRQAGGEGSVCYANVALRHPEFGFLTRGELPLRYYTVDWPGGGSAASAPADPRVRVLVMDSNTLDVVGGLMAPAEAGRPARTDALQLLWMENQLRTAPEGTWTLMVMHHPPYSPRGCVFRFMGQCVGGHDDDNGLKAQFRAAWGAPLDDLRASGPFHPDFVFAAHNHLYARTASLDGAGYPARTPGAGVRYFVTGGGGAPLYRLQPLHARYAAGGSFHHFVYLRLQAGTAFFWAIDDRGAVKDAGCFRRGETADRCIARGSYGSATLACGEVVPVGGSCAPPAP